MKKKKKRFNRFTALSLIVIMVFTAIISRLAVLQIVKADEYVDKANTKAITEIQENAPRGNILDRTGTVLADNIQSYNVTFAETDDSTSNFFGTMDLLFKILDDNKETQKDDFALKINPFRFEFNAQDDDARKALEIRFKRDRGLNEKVQRELFPNQKDPLTDDEEEKVNEEMLKISPEDTFKYLVDQYKVAPQEIFRKIIDQYKSNQDDTISKLNSRYNITFDDSIKGLLDQYAKTSKKADKDSIFNSLLDKFQVNNSKVSEDKVIELERRYILVKDALKMQSFSGYKPIIIASNISKETAFIFSQKLNDLPGVDISMQPMRYYPFGELGSAVIGYISKIGTNQGKYETKGYDVNTDYIGISGIEGVFEDRLKGSKGAKIVKLNRQGRVIEELGSRESYPGQNIQLTIDKNVQYAAEVALDKTMAQLQKAGLQNDVDTSNATRGAAVAIDVNTGAVLALASRPGFNPNDFADPRGLSTDQFKKYFDPDYVAFAKSRGLSDALIEKLFPVESKTKKKVDKYDFVPKPLYNYATFSLVPPGSTFKPMTAVAGLETGVINPSFTVYDQGFYTDGQIPPISFPSDGANGQVNLTKALAVSSNPYFMTVGNLLRNNYGDDILAQYSWKFGLGVDPQANPKPKASTGIELPENFGQVSNTWSIQDRFSQSFLWQIEAELRSGYGSSTNSHFPSLDLYDDINDSKEVAAAKQPIKDKIIQAVKTGNMADSGQKKMSETEMMNLMEGLLKKLISVDPKYKGVNFSNGDIVYIAKEILSMSVYSGHTEVITPGNMYNASIGQGISAFTPLQLADYIATIVNGGTRYKLHVVDKITDAGGNVIEETKSEVLEKTGIKQSTIDAVKQGMKSVTDSGTAAGIFNGLPVETAGKTGSATARSDQDELGRTSYAVYVGFAPYDKPQIAVAVLVFDGGHGGFIAPVARAIYEAYFKEQLDAAGYTPVNDVVAKPIQ